jgi:hypothetical protein
MVIMIKLIQLLIEGGWSSKLTQDTRLTPAVVEECVYLYDKFVKDFNKYLVSKGLAEVQAGKPVGSSAYFKKDLQDNPDKEYGDVDMMFYIPKIEGASDNKNKSIYSKEILEYLKDNQNVQSENGTNLIFKLKDGGYAQIDLVNAYYENKDWAAARMTPERGIKGAIGGYLYSSLADILNLSISANGVQIKLKNNSPVKFTSGKVDKIDTVTRDISNLGVDICKYYYKIITNKDPETMKISQSLKKTPGINPEDVKNLDIANTVKGIGDTLELNGLFGKGSLSDIDSASDFINKVAKVYYDKMNDAINAPKFDKAEGPEGQRKAEDAKAKLTAGLKQTLQYLK